MSFDRSDIEAQNADSNDPTHLLAIAMAAKMLGIRTAMPGIVNSYDPIHQTVSVQPAIQAEFDGLGQVNLPLLVDVPVLFLQGGNFVVTFPIAKGDEALIVFSDRGFDRWFEYGGTQPRTEDRTHSLCDGFAIVGLRSKPRKLTDVQTDGVEVRSIDRSVALKMQGSGVEIIGNVHLTGTLTADTDVIGGGKSLKNHTHVAGTLLTAGPYSVSGTTGKPS